MGGIPTPNVTESQIAWIKKQKLFWIATATTDKSVHVNVSPRGLSDATALKISDDGKKIWWVDLTGSGKPKKDVSTRKINAHIASPTQASKQSPTSATPPASPSSSWNSVQEPHSSSASTAQQPTTNQPHPTLLTTRPRPTPAPPAPAPSSLWTWKHAKHHAGSLSPFLILLRTAPP